MMNQKKIITLFLIILFVGLLLLIPLTFYHDKISNNILLPSPDTTGKILLEDALTVVNKTTSFQPSEQLALSTIGQLLWAMQGVTRGYKRTAPSAGALYPLELYLYPFDVEDLPDGFYQYKPQKHDIEKVHSNVFTKDYLDLNLFSNNSHLESAQALIFITAIPERTTIKYGSRGLKYIDLEVGHVLGNLYVQAVTKTVHISPIFHFNEMQIKADFEIDEELVAVIPVIKTVPYDLCESLNSKQQQVLFGGNTHSNNLTVEQAIFLRQSIRNYESSEIQLPILKRLLWYAFINKTSLLPNASKPIVFSKDNILSLYLFTEDRLSNYDAGIYEVNSENLNFSLFRSGEYIDDLYRAGLSQSSIRAAAINLVFLFNTSISEQIVSDNFSKLILYDIGLISQFFYLEARNLDLGMVVIGAFYDNSMQDLFENIDLSTTYIIPVGVSKLSSTSLSFIRVSKYTLSRVAGIITLLLLYFSCFTATRPFKEKFAKKWLLTHHLFSLGFTLGFLVTHFLLVVDMVPFLQSGNFVDVLFQIGLRLVGNHLYPIDSFFKAGQLVAIFTFWVVIFTNIISILLYKTKLFSPECRKKPHQILVSTIFLGSFIHIYANCLNTIFLYWLFSVINIMIILSFITVQFQPPLFQKSKKCKE